MKIYVSLYFLFFFALTILISCQQTSNQTEYFSNIEKNLLDQKHAQELEGLSENHNYLDLSLSTLTQQNIEKEKAAKGVFLVNHTNKSWQLFITCICG